MAKKPLPIENRLILSLAAHNGTATLTEIRLNFYGRLTCVLLEQAIQKLGDLVTIEKARSKGSRRPTTRLSLTLKGWAAVQFLRPGWQPQRLATDVLKAWLADLQAERDPWAVQFIVDAEDAHLWRRQESERKKRDREAERKRAEREKPEPRYPSAGRSRSAEDLEQRAQWLAEKTGKTKDAEDESADDQTTEFRGHSAEAQSFVGGDAQAKFAAYHAQREADGIDPITGNVNGPPSPRAMNLPYVDYDEVKRRDQPARDAELIKTCIQCGFYTTSGEMRPAHYHASTGRLCPGSDTQVAA